MTSTRVFFYVTFLLWVLCLTSNTIYAKTTTPGIEQDKFANTLLHSAIKLSDPAKHSNVIVADRDRKSVV